MTETSEDYELFHHGVKGMKWGVRKDRGGGDRVASAYRKTKKKLKERDESILDARKKVAEADAADKAIVAGLKTKKRALKESGLTRKEVRSEYKKAKADVRDIREEHAKKWLDNYSRAQAKTTKEILATSAYRVGTLVVPPLSYNMARTKANRINSNTAKYFAEAYRQAAPSPRNALSAPNVIPGEVVR